MSSSGWFLFYLKAIVVKPSCSVLVTFIFQVKDVWPNGGLRTRQCGAEQRFLHNCCRPGGCHGWLSLPAFGIEVSGDIMDFAYAGCNPARCERSAMCGPVSSALGPQFHSQCCPMELRRSRACPPSRRFLPPQRPGRRHGGARSRRGTQMSPAPSGCTGVHEDR